ncbi:MAG: DUF4249 family protein [Bacteroidetes bacterium]|nr:DUF4249 family protein [Bacteroidota bacterium]
MKSLLKIFLFFLILPVFSCKTDFDVTASYKEIAVVYGLLDQTDSIHYLRITKAFLGKGNALVYAQQADSSAFGPEVKVWMQDVDSAGKFSTITMDTASIYDKDTGVFYSPNQKMYATSVKLNKYHTYNLFVEDTISKNLVTSRTNLIQDFSIIKPSSLKIGFDRKITTTQELKWRSAVNGRLYLPVIRFYFKESSSPNDTLMRVIDWVFPSTVSADVEGGKEMSIGYKNEQFYNLCETQIPYTDQAKEEAVLVRIPDHFDISFTVVGDEFNTYLELNGPTTGLLLEKPVYSNINNGIGVFSCHFIKHSVAKVNDITKAELQNTTNLHFFAN